MLSTHIFKGPLNNRMTRLIDNREIILLVIDLIWSTPCSDSHATCGRDRDVGSWNAASHRFCVRCHRISKHKENRARTVVVADGVVKFLSRCRRTVPVPPFVELVARPLRPSTCRCVDPLPERKRHLQAFQRFCRGNALARLKGNCEMQRSASDVHFLGTATGEGIRERFAKKDLGCTGDLCLVN